MCNLTLDNAEVTTNIDNAEKRKARRTKTTANNCKADV